MSKYRKDIPAVIPNPAKIVADPKVRKWLYAIATAVIPLLVVYGVLAENTVSLWVGLAGAILSPAATGLAAANTKKTE